MHRSVTEAMERAPREQYPDDDVRITATIAKRVFRIGDEDLLALDVEEKRNPHGRSRPPMRLFLVGEVYAASKRVHANNPKFHPDTGRAITTTTEEKYAKRDAVCQKVSARLFADGVPPDAGIEGEAWDRVVDQNRDAPRQLAQREIVRRWKGEVALLSIPPDDRDLAMLSRNELRDGAPNADDVPALVEARRARKNTLEAYDSVFWSLCGVHMSTAIADAHGQVFQNVSSMYERFRRLADAMSERGVAIRCDSRMCSEYVADYGSTRPVSDVVDVMEEMAWLYANDADLKYTSVREDAFRSMFQDAKEWGGWIPQDEMQSIGDDASESAKRTIANKLAREKPLESRVQPLPRSMQRRVSRIRDQIERETRDWNERVRMVQEALAPKSLMHIALENLCVRDFPSVPECVLDTLVREWCERRLRLVESLLRKPAHKKAVVDAIPAIQVGVVATTSKRSQWVAIGSFANKKYHIVRLALGVLGMDVRETRTEKGHVNLLIASTHEIPFRKIGVENARVKRLLERKV